MGVSNDCPRYTSFESRMSKVKSPEEIRRRLRDLVHKHRKAYIKKHLDYNPSKCSLIGMGLYPECKGCTVARGCQNKSKFDLIDGIDEIIAQFEADIKNPEKLVRDFRDVALLLWVLGSFDDANEAVHQLDNALTEIPTSTGNFHYSVSTKIPVFVDKVEEQKAVDANISISIQDRLLRTSRALTGIPAFFRKKNLC